MKRDRDRPLSQSLRTLRWIIVVGIFVIVIGYQGLKEFALDFGAAESMVTAILLYACVGSLVTWTALTWASNQIIKGEQAEQSGREKNRYTASIAASSADAILSMDSEGTITSWNKGAELIFGYKEPVAWR